MTRLSKVVRGSILIVVALSTILSTPERSQAFQRGKKFDLTGSVSDSNGNAIEGARIILAHKSWPNNRFRMKTYVSKTSDQGVFSFKNRYNARQASEFLITVVADGHAMVSQYIENQSGAELEPVEFELEKAIPKTIVFEKAGKPLANARVFAKSRTNRDGDEHFIYPISTSKMTLQTDDQGKVKMNIFQSGDRVILGVHRKGKVDQINLTIDSSLEQSIEGTSSGSGQNDIAATVRDDSGNPIADAIVLISHKTWPNNRFQMSNYAGETGSDGNYRLPGVYQNNGRNGILISVLAEGYTMKSQYLSTQGEALQSFEFKLDTAKSRKLTFQDSQGNAISNARILPVSRTDSEGEEHMIYPASAGDFSIKTNADGSIDLNLFNEGDEIEFLVQMSGGPARVKATMQNSSAQTIAVKKKLMPR